MNICQTPYLRSKVLSCKQTLKSEQTFFLARVQLPTFRIRNKTWLHLLLLDVNLFTELPSDYLTFGRKLVDRISAGTRYYWHVFMISCSLSRKIPTFNTTEPVSIWLFVLVFLPRSKHGSQYDQLSNCHFIHKDSAPWWMFLVTKPDICWKIHHTYAIIFSLFNHILCIIVWQ